jgi:hypothetical protein
MTCWPLQALAFAPASAGVNQGMSDSAHTYRWITDESEAASGDEIVYADESEWIDDDEDE